ncbi:MAG: hypothetical protein QGI32_26440, partial [Candidatus Latescibacteria bacterium]|nr:hypothetical protein [Candidatus Latescibacterota bacterium]
RTVAAIPDIIRLFLPQHLDGAATDVLWGPYPLTIHSAGWGILFNLLVTVVVSVVWHDDGATQKGKDRRHRLLQSVSGIAEDRRRLIPLGWLLTLVWFLVGFGPFAVVGNNLFSNPNLPATWWPFGLPSLWVWQLAMLLFGLFVMWFLAFYLGLSKPVPPEVVEAARDEQFPEAIQNNA